MPLLVAVSLLSAAAIAYEILLTRLFAIALWHHFAYMIISLALLGYGASGTFLVFVRHRALARFGVSFAALAVSFGVAAIGCYALAWRLPFNPLEVIWDWRQQLYLAAMYLLLALPFLYCRERHRSESRRPAGTDRCHLSRRSHAFTSRNASS